MVEIGETRLAIAAAPRIGTAAAVLKEVADHESQVKLALLAEPSSDLSRYPPRPPVIRRRCRTHLQTPKNPPNN